MIASCIIYGKKRPAGALHESFIVCAIVVAPGNLGQGGEAGEGVELDVVEIGHIFGPYISLYAFDMAFLFIGQTLERLELITLG